VFLSLRLCASSRLCVEIFALKSRRAASQERPAAPATAAHRFPLSTMERIMITSQNTKQSRVPSRRDQEIYARVIVHCERQCDVAKDLGLSAGRISQILSRVRHWLAVGQTFLSAANSHSARHAHSALEIQRLHRHLAQARHEYLYELSIRAIKQMSDNPKHTTVRTEYEPTDEDSLSPVSCPLSPDSLDPEPRTPSKIVKTVRDQPLNVQFIKTAQRSALELQKLAELDPLPPPEISADQDRRQLAVDLITDLLDDAAATGKVRPVGWETERPFVEDLMSFMLGESHRGLATTIIAADAQHGRFRPKDRLYPGRDPMRAASSSPATVGRGSPDPALAVGRGSPDPAHTPTEGLPLGDVTHYASKPALNNTKLQNATINPPNAQAQSESADATQAATATSNHSAAARLDATASKSSFQKNPKL
jgi:hypothetical protein